MKLKDVFDLIHDCYIDIHRVNPYENDPLVLYDDWVNSEKDLTIVLERYGEYPVISITCCNDCPVIIITI